MRTLESKPNNPASEDAAVVEAARRGDKTAFTALAERYRRELHAYCYRMLGSFHDSQDLVIGSAPPERAGAASAMSETSAELGGALGIALFGSIGVAVYRSVLGDAVPASVPSEAAEAAQSTLAGALSAASELPGAVAVRLTESAQSAFLAGVKLCAWVSTFGALALAGFAWLSLRRARGAAEASGIE